MAGMLGVVVIVSQEPLILKSAQGVNSTRFCLEAAAHGFSYTFVDSNYYEKIIYSYQKAIDIYRLSMIALTLRNWQS